MDRRSFLKLALGVSVSAAWSGSAHSDVRLAGPATPPAGLIKQRWISPPDCYFAYPHKNGFVPNTAEIIITACSNERLVFQAWDYRNGAIRELINVSRGGDGLWSDVAEATGQMTLVRDRYKIVVLNATGDPEPRVVYTAPSDKQIGSRFASFRPDGKTILFATRARVADSDHPLDTLCEVDAESGEVSELAALPISTDHYHYCPFDPRWVAFCHNEAIEKTDRIWGMNRSAGIAPTSLWDQQTPSGSLHVGHERWAFHRAGAYAIAYPGSPGRPQGLYFVDAATKSASIVSEAECFLHCNVDHAGRWAVVDTANMAYRPLGQKTGLRQEADGRSIADVVLVNVITGKQYWVARSHMKNHPWHAHPHLSPDARYIVYNDYQADGAGTPSHTVVLEIDTSVLG